MFTKYLPYLLADIVEKVILSLYQKVNIYVFILITYYVKGVNLSNNFLGILWQDKLIFQISACSSPAPLSY